MAVTLASLLGGVSSRNWMEDLAAGTSVVGYNPDEEIVTFELSIGVGRSSTVVKVPHDQIDNICDVFADFDPEAEDVRTDRPIVDIIRSTLTVEREERPKDHPKDQPFVGKILSYQFKTSDKPHTRSVVVPTAEWDKFRQYLAGLTEHVTPELIESFSALQSEENARAAEKASKKAAREAERSNPTTPAK